MELDKDEYYRDILEGLSVYFASSFITDVLATLSKFDAPDLGASLNANQIIGKKWLLDELYQAAGESFDTIYVLGGWYGVLAAMLLHDRRLDINKVINIDIHADCKLISESLNHFHVASEKFCALTADMFAINYHDILDSKNSKTRPNLIINTSCEHLNEFDNWYNKIPAGALQVLQSNDYYACSEHINCIPNLEAFKVQAPLQKCLFSGSLKLKKYTRFMLIGYK